MAALVLAGGTTAGIVLTLIAGQEPGLLLGFFVIAATLAAAFGIRREALYLLFPMPAFAFFVAAVLTGLVHDSRLISSTAGFGASFVQWIGGIFFPMMIATVLAVLIGGVRWALGSQLVTGMPPAAPVSRSGSPGNARPAPVRRSAADDQWSADDPFADPVAKPGRGGRGGQPARRNSSSPGYTGARPARPARDQRTDRDPWGDPRLAADRGQAADRSQPPADRTRGTGPTPPSGTGPTPQPRGTGPSSQPRGAGPGRPPADGTGLNPQPRDRTPRSRPDPSWTPASRPASRPQPPEGWTPR